MLTSTRPLSTGRRFSLVDAEQAEELLSRRSDIFWPGGHSPSAVHIERVWPVGDSALAAEWSFLLSDGQRVSVQVMPLDSRGGDASTSLEPALCGGELHGLRALWPEHGVEVHTIDRDSVLTEIPDCLDAGTMGRRLASYFSPSDPRGDEAAPLEIRRLSYRARRRATIRYRHDRQRLVGKIFRDDRGERAAQRHFQLRERLFQNSGGRVTVPVPVDYLPDLRMLLLGWNEPRELPAVSAATDELWMVMRALTALHATTLADLPGFSCADEIAVVERWAGLLATVAVERTNTLRRLIPVWRLRTPPTQRCVTVHRDFYSRQVLLGDNQATLIDLDTLSSGDAAVDLGNFLAHRWLDALQHAGDSASERFEHQARETIVAYQTYGGRPRRTNLRWYWAAALLRLGAVHALRTVTGRFSESLWATAADLIGATGLRSTAENIVTRGAVPLFDVEAVLAEVRE